MGLCLRPAHYGYDWILPNDPARRATTVGNQEAVLLAAQMGAAIQYDETAQSPFFTYLLEGQEHIVWFEDARSVQAKFRLAENLALGGAAYWNLLRTFPQNWALLSQEVAIRREEPI